MTLQNDISTAVSSGDGSGAAKLTVVFRQFEEESKMYYVAECLEIPGCISQGDTLEEAARNIEDAIQACINVICRDLLVRIAEGKPDRDLRNIKEQRNLTITLPELRVAFA